MASQLLPTTNGDDLPIVPMTEGQRYIFDVKGWICLPGLLSDDELGAVLEHQHKLMEEPESLPPEERNSVGGPSQVMLDHPVLAGVLNEIVSHQGLASEDCYGFRFERTRTERRPFGNDNFGAHGGSGYFNLCGDSHLYQMLPGKIHAGLTRVVWELNEVGPGDGVTMFIPGSHKAAFERPDEVSGRDSPLWETYTCPPGSVVVFTEGLCHTGSTWTNRERDRLCLFSLYNTVNCRWGRSSVPPEVVAAMPPKRRTLFRDVWVARGKPINHNLYFDDKNFAA